MLETVIPGVIIIIVLVIMLIVNRLKIRGLEELAERNLHDRRAVVNFLNRFAHSVSTADNIDNAIIALARYISDAIHARSLCIFFAEKDSQQLRAQAIIGPFPSIDDFDTTCGLTQEEINSKTFKVGCGLIGRIAANKKPVLIRSSDSELLANMKEGVQIDTAMLVPVVLEGELKGLLCAVNTVDNSSYTARSHNTMLILIKNFTGVNINVLYTHFIDLR